jgi:RNA polymerase sigma-70 factor (ECF subfamily)
MTQRSTLNEPSGLTDKFWREHHGHLWGLCYRMTGSAADADDLVQDTFVKVFEKPPAKDGRSVRGWLVKVAMNLARDLLRRRRRTAYTGPWLPSPVTTDDEAGPLGAIELEVAGLGSTESRYDLVESVSFAFLVALEQLTPQQRAILLLRDVFDSSVAETADILDCSQAAVKTTLHRARRKLAAYDAAERRVSKTGKSKSSAIDVVNKMIELIVAGDVDGFASLLADDVRAMSDGAGVYRAALKPIEGARNVARFYIGLFSKLAGAGLESNVTVRLVNGLPAVAVEIPGSPEGLAPRFVQLFDIDAEGMVRGAYSVLAPKKLTAAGFAGAHPAAESLGA